MGEQEALAARKVVRSGALSAFFGSPGEFYNGGDQVRAFEDEWAARFKVKHAISVNSATSGIMAAMGAIKISPGDEVIVPPLTMSATVMAPLVYGGIPVFADVEAETGCISPSSVAAAITPLTRAIIAVNLFGHPARLQQLRALAKEKGIYLIEDNAQGLLAQEYSKLAGTIGDIGVFSLNYHKHIHTGEGGMCVTDDSELADRLRLIRNHGENAIEAYGIEDITNMIGFNWRLTELQAAIGRIQLQAIDEKVADRKRVAERLSQRLINTPGIIVPRVRKGCKSAWYVWMARIDTDAITVTRDVFSGQLTAEGIPHMAGYVQPLYMLPVFQRRRAIGRDGWPFSLSKIRYSAGMCPVAERLTNILWFGIEMCRYDFPAHVVDQVADAIHNVFMAYASRHRQH